MLFCALSRSAEVSAGAGPEAFSYGAAQKKPAVAEAPAPEYTENETDTLTPKEAQITNIMVIRKGITIKMRPGSMGYSPSLSKGNPGVLIMDPEASYSAWLHELKHIEDDEASGWSGFQLIQDIERFAALEDAAYAAEIDFARKNGYIGTARRLERLRFERRQEILGIQRNNKQPHE